MPRQRVDDVEMAGARVQIVTTQKWVRAVDQYRAKRWPIPSRSDVIRVAVSEWLAAQAKPK